MPRDVIVLPGEGIGPEVIRQARRVIDWLGERRGLDIAVREEAYGVAAYRRHGGIVADEVRADLPTADAVLFGATGGPEFEEIPLEVRRAGSLLAIRREMQVFANLRPIVGYAELADASALKPDLMAGVDLIVVRELNGGLYFGEPRGIEDLPDGRQLGVNTLTYATDEIERIARAAFVLARGRDGRLCSVDKSNVLETGRLWREVVTRVGADEFPDVQLSHILVDNCAMQLAREPRQFDVLVADNMFGDILSDIGGAVAGSLGMLPSASLAAPGADGHRAALYEPVHGSAPDIAGRGVANPLGAVLSVALMLRHSLDREDDAALLERAVRRALGKGARTPDIRAPNRPAVSTEGMGDAVITALAELTSG